MNRRPPYIIGTRQQVTQPLPPVLPTESAFHYHLHDNDRSNSETIERSRFDDNRNGQVCDHNIVERVMQSLALIIIVISGLCIYYREDLSLTFSLYIKTNM